MKFANINNHKRMQNWKIEQLFAISRRDGVDFTSLLASPCLEVRLTVLYRQRLRTLQNEYRIWNPSINKNIFRMCVSLRINDLWLIWNIFLSTKWISHYRITSKNINITQCIGCTIKEKKKAKKKTQKYVSDPTLSNVPNRTR